MGIKPTAKHQIDRKNPNGNYFPENCRRVTPQQQGSENRRGLRAVDIQGMHFHSLKRACAHFGAPYTTVIERIKHGISIEQALTAAVWKMPTRRTRESYLRKDRR